MSKLKGRNKRKSPNRSMGQAISAWTSPIRLTGDLGNPVAASSPDYDKYQSQLKKQFRSSKDSGVGYYYDNGNMMYFDKKHFEPTIAAKQLLSEDGQDELDLGDAGGC